MGTQQAIFNRRFRSWTWQLTFHICGPTEPMYTSINPVIITSGPTLIPAVNWGLDMHSLDLLDLWQVVGVLTIIQLRLMWIDGVQKMNSCLVYY